MSLLSQARRAYIKRPSRELLRTYLIYKARAGQFDERMWWGVTPINSSRARRELRLAWKDGLVPTSTTGGSHAPGSLHYQKRAIDFGLIGRHIGTAYGRRKMVGYQRKAYKRRVYAEVIGPDNNLIILRGSPTRLPEGNVLENQHDNHVHIGW